MTNTEVQVEAGEYILVDDRFLQPLDRDNPQRGFKDHQRGDRVTLDETDALRLYSCGSVALEHEPAARKAMLDSGKLTDSEADKLRADELEARAAEYLRKAAVLRGKDGGEA